MKKFMLLSSVLFFALSLTSFAQWNTSMELCPELRPEINPNAIETMWDVKFNYDASVVTTAAGNAGAQFIPTLNKFWTSRWATGVMHSWNVGGTLDAEFTLSFTGTRGIAWDGQFTYHSINTTTVQKVNPATRLVVGTVSVVGAPNGARFITYDPTANSGAGGIIVGNWTAPNLNFYVFSLTGTLLRTITNATTGVYGIAYDNQTAGGPWLWVWSQGTGAGTPQIIKQMNYTTGVYTAVQHDVKTDVGIGQPTQGIAGALFLTTALYPGMVTLGGMMQGVPDRLFGYELGAIVPVELKSFAASVTDGKVQLNWSTATETNNRGFEVQKSNGNGFFNTIGFVEGKGTTTETQFYTFYDKANVGKSVYRLKQLDFNGDYEFTQQVEVEYNPTSFELSNNYPNPFNPSTKIDFSLLVDSRVSLKVFNVLGQEVATLVNGDLSAGSHSINFNASDLTTGVYVYKIEAVGADGQNFSATKKMLLNK